MHHARLESARARTALAVLSVGAAALALAGPATAGTARPAATAAAPVVTGLSRTTGPTAGGTQVTISGTGLDGATSVTFGTAKASAVSVAADGSSVTATSPAGTGPVDVRVLTGHGTSGVVAADHFLYGGPAFSAALVAPDEPNSTAVRDVACPAAGSCYAVGFTGVEYNNGGITALVSVLAHGSWIHVPVSPPPGVSTNAKLTAVACPAVGECYAIGVTYPKQSDETPVQFAEVLHDGSWTAVTLPSDATWVDVACAASGRCTAVGTDGTATRLLRLDERGLTVESGWAAPAGATSIGVGGIQCPTADSCIVWGAYTDAQNAPHAYAEQRIGGTWYGTALPSSGGRTPSDVDAVTCTSATNCTGYGNFADDTPMKVVLRGSAVTTSAVAITGLPSSVPHRLASIGCATATRCVASTDLENTQPSRTAYGSVLGSRGWRAQAFGTTGADVATGVGGTFCSAGRSCVLTGERVQSFGYVTAAAVPTVLLPTGSTLTQLDLPIAAHVQQTYVASTDTGACAPNSAFCVVFADDFYRYGPGEQDFAITITG